MARKIKSLIIEKLKLNEKTFIGIERLEKFMSRHHLMASKSFEDYVMRNTSKRRLTICWIINVFIALNTIKYGILSVYNPKWLLVLFGEFVYKLGPFNLISGICFFGGCIASFRQFMNLYFEQKYKFKAIDVLFGLKTRNKSYQLNCKYMKSFCFRSTLMSKLFLESLLNTTTIIMALMMASIAYMAYDDPDMNHNPLNLIISLVIFIVWCRYLFAIYSADFFLFFCIALYLKYSFRQLMGPLKWTALSVTRVLSTHNRLTKLTKTLNKFFCNSLGILYACGTPAINILLTLLINETNIWKRLFYGFVITQLQVLMYLITYSAATISIENIKFPKYLYPLFIKRHLSIMNSLKYSSFLEKLSNNFIGFYCFNFFAYTKLSFFNYTLYVTSNYMLYHKKIN